jgi:hypothetical protein
MPRSPLPAIRCAAIAVLCASCGGSSPTQPPAGPSPSPSPAAQPSPVPSPSPAVTACSKGSFAPGPVTRLAVAPRALQSNGVSAPMRTRYVGPGEELLCLESEKSHRLDFNLNQRNALGQESCWEGFPSYRIRGDTEHMVTGTTPIDDNGFVFRVRVEPNKNVASFGVEAELDGVFSHPWLSGGQYPREPLRVITLPGEEIGSFCPCIYLGNGGYEGGSCVR